VEETRTLALGALMWGWPLKKFLSGKNSIVRGEGDESGNELSSVWRVIG
jgi:hypothetical protein